MFFAYIKLLFSIWFSLQIFLNANVNGQMFNTMAVNRVRATQYVPRVIDKTCLLKPEYGPCRANIAMYYFNPATMNCSTFQWGGCQGNGNRFDTAEQCRSTCVSVPNQNKNVPKYCSLSFDYGFCFGAVYRYYYDPLWKVCKQRIYSGCGGNGNNFYSFEQCESVCRFGAGHMTILDKNKQRNMKKALIINPWQHTRTTTRTTTVQSGSTLCADQTTKLVVPTADPDDCNYFPTKVENTTSKSDAMKGEDGKDGGKK